MSSADSRCSAGSKRVTFKTIFGFLGDALRLRDVACLAALASAIGQQDEQLSAPRIIYPVARADMDATLPDLIADRPRVRSISCGEALQSIIDPEPRSTVAKTVKPIAEGVS